jgi:NTP pyrophosphatase (non-canonical NTP hydrolase)
MNDLTFKQLRLANLDRCNQSFHPGGGVGEWTPTDWATAMAGECGEACNAVKKLRRLETAASWRRAEDGTAGDLRDAVAEELADLIAYADLLAARLGIDLGAAVALKFNRVSERVGSAARL